MQQLAQRLGFGLEPVGAPLGFGQRLPRHIERLTRAPNARPRRASALASPSVTAACAVSTSLRKRREIREAAAVGLDLGEFGDHRGDFAFQPRQPFGLLARGTLPAPCGAR